MADAKKYIKKIQLPGQTEPYSIYDEEANLTRKERDRLHRERLSETSYKELKDKHSPFDVTLRSTMKTNTNKKYSDSLPAVQCIKTINTTTKTKKRQAVYKDGIKKSDFRRTFLLLLIHYPFNLRQAEENQCGYCGQNKLGEHKRAVVAKRI